MTHEQRALHFSIEGAFITRLAREKLYVNHDLPAALELLKSCTCADGLSDADQTMLCIDILEGRKEIVGTYPNDDYGIAKSVPTDKTPGILACFGQIKKKNEELEAKLFTLEQKLGFIYDALPDYKLAELNEEWHTCVYDEEDEEEGNNPWLFPHHSSARLGAVGDSRMPPFSAILSAADCMGDNDPERRVEAMNRAAAEAIKQRRAAENPLDDFMTAQRVNKGDDYGWLSPAGVFTPVEWGEHQGWANDYLKTHWAEFGLPEDEDERDDIIHERLASLSSGDLLADRGWVLLHSPSHGVARPSYKPGGRLTKAQNEFLFGYYTDRGLDDMAREYLQD